MELFKPVYFDFISELTEFTVNDINRQFNELNMTINQVTNKKSKYSHTLPDDLLKKINSELISKGWPELWYLRTYIRPPNATQRIHLDGLEEIIHASVNIPVTGCANTKHLFKIGKFETILSTCGTFQDIVWLDNDVETIELVLDCPHLVRIEVPHGTISNSTEPRWVMTLRFKGNPSYESLSDLIK